MSQPCPTAGSIDRSDFTIDKPQLLACLAVAVIFLMLAISAGLLVTRLTYFIAQ